MNLTALQNITPLTVNDSLVNETTTIGTKLISNATQTTDGYFGLGIMVIIFLFLLMITMADQDVFRLRFSSAFLFASSMATLTGIVLLIANATSSFQHVMWFAILFLVALLMKYYEKG